MSTLQVIYYSCSTSHWSNWRTCPVGWGILRIESEGMSTKTMQVHVYPELWCEFRDGRWWLLPPKTGLAWATEAERTVFEARVAFESTLQREEPTIRASLWKPGQFEVIGEISLFEFTVFKWDTRGNRTQQRLRGCPTSQIRGRVGAGLVSAHLYIGADRRPAPTYGVP